MPKTHPVRIHTPPAAIVEHDILLAARAYVLALALEDALIDALYGMPEYVAQQLIRDYDFQAIVRADGPGGVTC